MDSEINGTYGNSQLKDSEISDKWNTVVKIIITVTNMIYKTDMQNKKEIFMKNIGKIRYWFVDVDERMGAQAGNNYNTSKLWDELGNIQI